MNKPDVKNECPNPIEQQLYINSLNIIDEKFAEKLFKDETLYLEMKSGQHALCLAIRVGTQKKAMLFEFLIRKENSSENEMTAILIDFVIQSLFQYFESNRQAAFSLDYVGHPFEDDIIFARSEWRNYEAEIATADFLKQHGLEGL